MEKESARQATELLLGATSRIDQALAVLQKACGDEEFNEYRQVGGKAMGEIFLDILEPIWAEYPDLQPESLRKK